VRVLNDGSSKLVFAGAKVKWHVVGASAPGRWNGHDDPTLLNGVAWLPGWPAAGDNANCNCDSTLSPDLPSPLKAMDQTVTVTVLEGRGNVSITQQPAAANGYVLQVQLDDPQVEASWYEFMIGYTAK
jgi:hypothetical protein